MLLERIIVERSQLQLGKELGLHSQTVQAVVDEYCKCGKQFKRPKLNWRSRKRSLGWVPFKAVGVKVVADSVTYAGHTFRRTTKVDAHHGFARYGWELVGPDGSVAVAGLDVIRLADDGKLAGEPYCVKALWQFITAIT